MKSEFFISIFFMRSLKANDPIVVTPDETSTASEPKIKLPAKPGWATAKLRNASVDARPITAELKIIPREAGPVILSRTTGLSVAGGYLIQDG